jgi:(1->4)-alpha-D-glucan 1-alpha-D-glucosylmutase
LNALSEVPADWERSIHRWRRLNARHKNTVRGRVAPDTNTEYLLYQTLIALWPPPRPGRRSDDIPDRAWRESTRERLEQYMIKAVREAKTRTSWTSPDTAYEAALRSFIRAVLTPAEDAPFLADVARLVSHIAPAGAWSALSRLIIHLTAPGTPDIYQGDELWTFALVDPDNRRPVDYDARRSLLDAVSSIAASDPGRREALDPFDARMKLHIVHRLLDARRSHAALFSRGEYQPLVLTGSRASKVVAFLRSYDGQHAICIAGRLLCELDASPRFNAWWDDTAVQIPDAVVGGGRTWRSVIDGGEVRITGALPLRVALTHFPGAVLLAA